MENYTKQQIIKAVQAGHVNFATEENVFVPMTPDQRVARSAAFVAGLKQNFYKLQARARFKQ